MRTALFVQARLNSNRLSKKMLQPIYKDKSIIYLSLEAFSYRTQLNYDEKVLLIPYNETPYFKDVADEFGFNIIEGPESDVLGRFILGLNEFSNIEVVVRGCADKIVIDKFHQDLLYTEYENNPCDLIHIIDDPVRSATSEIYRATALIAASLFYNRESCWIEGRQHIKPLFTKHSQFWNINTVSISEGLKKKPIDISINTEEDLERMRNLFSDLYTGIPLDFFDVLNWFAKNK